MALRSGVRLLQELTEHSRGLSGRLAVHRLADLAPTQRGRSLAHCSAGRRRAGQPEQHVRQPHGQIVASVVRIIVNTVTPRISTSTADSSIKNGDSPLIRRLKVESEVPHCPLRGFEQR